jgi:hypothetical protein
MMETAFTLTVLGEPQFEDGAVFLSVEIGIAGTVLTACVAGKTPAEIKALMQMSPGDTFTSQGQLVDGQLAEEVVARPH